MSPAGDFSSLELCKCRRAASGQELGGPRRPARVPPPGSAAPDITAGGGLRRGRRGGGSSARRAEEAEPSQPELQNSRRLTPRTACPCVQTPVSGELGARQGTAVTSGFRDDSGAVRPL